MVIGIDILKVASATPTLNMVKDLHGLYDSESQYLVAKPLKDIDVQGVWINDQSKKLTLKAMKNLCNVNAIANGSSLLVGHKGLSVIYGENGQVNRFGRMGRILRIHYPKLQYLIQNQQSFLLTLSNYCQ